MLRHELGQEVLQLRRLALRLVRQRVVLHRLGAADVVDPDDERLEVLVLAAASGSSARASPTATSETHSKAILRYVFITSAEPKSSTYWRLASSSGGS